MMDAMIIRPEPEVVILEEGDTFNGESMLRYGKNVWKYRGEDNN